MNKHRKTWSVQAKQEVIEYYKVHGSSKASRKYEVSAVSIGKWYKQYEAHGIEGLSGKASSIPKADLEYDRLLAENRELKAIVAEKELHIRIQGAMLKKSR